MIDVNSAGNKTPAFLVYKAYYVKPSKTPVCSIKPGQDKQHRAMLPELKTRLQNAKHAEMLKTLENPSKTQKSQHSRITQKQKQSKHI